MDQLSPPPPVFLAVLVFLLFVACEPNSIEEAIPKNEFNVEFKNGAIKFSSIDSYQNMVEDKTDVERSAFISFLQSKKDYNSLRKSYSKAKQTSSGRALGAKETEIAESNDFLASILNEDGLIAIGEYYFKINLNSERVFVLSVKNESELEDLKQEAVANQNILIFSTDDDVLLLLAEGSKGTASGRSQLFCRDSGAEDKKDDSFAVEPVYGDYRQDNKIVYQKAGVYFSLQAKTKMQYKSLVGLWVDAGITYNQQVRYYYKYEPKCRDISEGSATKTDDGPSNELNYRAYESIRGLHKYRYEAEFFGQGFWSRKYIIFDGF